MFIPIVAHEERCWGVELGYQLEFDRHYFRVGRTRLLLPVGLYGRAIPKSLTRMQRELQALLIRELPIELAEGDRIPWATVPKWVQSPSILTVSPEEVSQGIG